MFGFIFFLVEPLKCDLLRHGEWAWQGKRKGGPEIKLAQRRAGRRLGSFYNRRNVSMFGFIFFLVEPLKCDLLRHGEWTWQGKRKGGPEIKLAQRRAGRSAPGIPQHVCTRGRSPRAGTSCTTSGFSWNEDRHPCVSPKEGRHPLHTPHHLWFHCVLRVRVFMLSF